MSSTSDSDSGDLSELLVRFQKKVNKKKDQIKKLRQIKSKKGYLNSKYTEQINVINLQYKEKLNFLMDKRKHIISQIDAFKSVYHDAFSELSSFNQYLVLKMQDYCEDSLELMACYKRFIKDLPK